MTGEGDLPELPDLSTPLPDAAHDQLRLACLAIVAHVIRHGQQLRDKDEAKGDWLDVSGSGNEWTWTRYDAQGRVLGKADKPYSRRADAVRGGQRANPGL